MSPVRDFPAPRSARFVAAARAWLANPGEGPPVRGAATVLLLRDSADGPEVFVLRRAASMEFAPSMYVFPGGGVDPDDAHGAVPEVVVAHLAARMQLPPRETRSLIVCAVREAAEEVAVTLDPGELSVRGRWITPPFETRRYDTWFFAARLPSGQAAQGVTSESDHSRWVRPGDLIAERAAGTAVMLPPTIVMLEQLAACADVAAYLAVEPSVVAVAPELVETPEGLVLRARLP